MAEIAEGTVPLDVRPLGDAIQLKANSFINVFKVSVVAENVEQMNAFDKGLREFASEITVVQISDIMRVIPSVSGDPEALKKAISRYVNCNGIDAKYHCNDFDIAEEVVDSIEDIASGLTSPDEKNEVEMEIAAASDAEEPDEPTDQQIEDEEIEKSIEADEERQAEEDSPILLCLRSSAKVIPSTQYGLVLKDDEGACHYWDRDGTYDGDSYVMGNGRVNVFDDDLIQIQLPIKVVPHVKRAAVLEGGNGDRHFWIKNTGVYGGFTLPR